MKKFIFILIVCVVTGCNNQYTENTMLKLKLMKRPIVLIDKTKLTFWYSVVLQDSTGKIYKFGNLSKIANEIGENETISDTINIENYLP